MSSLSPSREEEQVDGLSVGPVQPLASVKAFEDLLVGF